MTFSITARCPRTGMLGIAISSSSPAVAARCVHARAGAGAVASQNITDPELGQIGLDLMARGRSAAEALAALTASSPFIAYRQLALVDRNGGTAAYCGAGTLGIHATSRGEGAVAAGNLLAAATVPKAMTAAFADASGMLAERLLAALSAGLAAGGEAGPVRSAGLYLVHEACWPIADLRVDWHDVPVAALHDLWAVYAPQMDDYVLRAKQPVAAPAFGVAGDP